MIRLFCYKFYPGAAATKLVAETFKHYNFFWQLRNHFKGEDMPYFSLTQKGHHCAHASMLCTSLSPRQGTGHMGPKHFPIQSQGFSDSIKKLSHNLHIWIQVQSQRGAQTLYRICSIICVPHLSVSQRARALEGNHGCIASKILWASCASWQPVPETPQASPPSLANFCRVCTERGNRMGSICTEICTERWNLYRVCTEICTERVCFGGDRQAFWGRQAFPDTCLQSIWRACTWPWTRLIRARARKKTHSARGACVCPRI